MKKTLKRLHAWTWAGLLALALAGGPASAFAADHAGLRDVAVFTGTGDYGEEDGALRSATFRSPHGIKLLPDGSLLIADKGSHLIRLAKDGEIRTLAGFTFETDARGNPVGALVDGEADASMFQSPSAVDVDAAGNIYVADTDNHAIRKIDPEGRVTTLAGSPVGAPGWRDGRGASARFYAPSALAVAPNGTVYVADTLNHAIRQITPAGVVSTLNAFRLRPVEVFDGVIEPAGDFKDGKLSEAWFNEPSGLALDDKGNLYVSDAGNQRIRYIDFAAGTVTTVAGGDESGPHEFYVPGDYADGAAAEARFDFPRGLAVMPDGGLLIADSGNHAVRLLQDGRVLTVVGNDQAAPGDASGTEKTARLTFPVDVAVDGEGAIYVADAYNNRIRVITDYAVPEGVADDGAIRVAIGGDLVAFDAMPVSRNWRVLVPVRAIAESLGYAVQPASDGRVVLAKEDVQITLRLGETRVEIRTGASVTEQTLDVAAFVENGRTYVPVRFVAEALGKQVDWLSARQLVVIR